MQNTLLAHSQDVDLKGVYLMIAQTMFRISHMTEESWNTLLSLYSRNLEYNGKKQLLHP